MPHSITLSSLAWSTPDGRVLFENLHLSFGPERTGLVGRNGVGKSTLIRLIAGAEQPSAGNVAFDGRLGLLRQDIGAAADETIADLFGVSASLALIKRAERGQASADDLADADWDVETRLSSALDRVGLKAAPATRLGELSGGQRTRASLAALVFAEPDFLLLDEPTNNLDQAGRIAVGDFLAGWRRGAIVVSHDRELLDRMDAIVELTSLGATRYGGNWTAYRARKAVELAAAERDADVAERHLAEVKRSAQVAAERKSRKDRAGARKSSKGDIPAIVLGAHKDRSETSGGDAARLADRQRSRAIEDVTAAHRRLEVLQPLAVDLPATNLASSKQVLHVDRLTAGYAARQPIIRDLCFSITGPERVGLCGANGSGKSTLLALIAGRLRPWSGSIRRGTPLAVLDQRVSLLDPALSLAENFRRLNPGADDNHCRAALARFMFRGDTALQRTGTLSGGQLLRAGLACIIGAPRPIPFLLLDEPTNHLDIDAIEAVEAGLRAYDGALLIVSHDAQFLANIGITRHLDLGIAPATLGPGDIPA